MLYDVKKITQDNIIACLKSVKKYNLTKIVILCNSYEANVVNLINSYNVKTLILNSTQTYNEILVKYNTYPEFNSNLKLTEKITLSFILKNAISKKKFKTYFLGGLFLLLASIFVVYNVYYIIFSSIMFLLSILSLFSDKIYKKSSNEIL